MEVNPSSKDFNVFSQCGKMEKNRTAKGNRLLIKLVLNNAILPSTEIELKLKGKLFLFFFRNDYILYH